MRQNAEFINVRLRWSVRHRPWKKRSKEAKKKTMHFLASLRDIITRFFCSVVGLCSLA